MKKIIYTFIIASITFACGSGTSESNTESTETDQPTEATNEAESYTDENSLSDIVDLASETESLSTLVTAVTAADLVTALKADGPFTVFAPTNEAFNALPEGTLSDLLKPENKDQLVSILTYHVVSGKVMSSDLVDGMEAETLNGAKVKISLTDGAKVNGANVVSADIEASNGVVHVIDAVIMPPSN